MNESCKGQILIFIRIVTPRFPKYVETESRREPATYIHEENTPRIHAKLKVARTSYKIYYDNSISLQYDK